jgi:hypothetical protein
MVANYKFGLRRAPNRISTTRWELYKLKVKFMCPFYREANKSMSVVRVFVVAGEQPHDFNDSEIYGRFC